ncbi:MAG: mechanosensitive ion channel [Candidatus Brocadia sp.]|nr:mechanosensitive ion channel [Candidatus Brocadia sp.]
MSLKYTRVKKRNIFMLIPFSKTGLVLYLGICFFWLGCCIDIQAQTIEKKEVEVKLSEMGVKVTTDDIEKARIKDEEVKTNVAKSMDEIKSSISNLERDRKAMDAYLERLRQEKEDYLGKGISQKFLELLDKEIDIVKEKIDIDNEQIETYEDRIEVLHDQSKAHDEIVVLLKSILGLEETLLTSHEQVPIVKKEADIAKSYITAVQAGIKEKESVISFFTNRLEEIKAKVSEDERNLAEYLDTLKSEIGDTELTNTIQEKIDSILLWKKAIGAQWIAIFETRLGTSRIRYDKGLLELKNAEFNAAFLAEKATRLEERLRSEELAKKQAELEAAKRAEEESRKIAERTKAEVEKTLQEAARKSEEIALEQMVTTSPEKKRVLELESEVHKQAGLIAKRKDELITEGAQRYKDFTEYKKLEADIGLLLSRGGTTKEIEESLTKIESDLKRFTESVATIESLIPSVKEEKKFISDNFAKSKEEIATIENEATSFSDKELARQAIEYANHIAKAIEEQVGLISTRLDRLQERLEIKKNALILLEKTKEKLITMKAANVWMRIESTISSQTVTAVYKDLMDCYDRRDSFYNIIPAQAKNFISYISHKRHTVTFWIRLCGLIGLIAGFYFSKKYIHRWSTFKTQALYEATGVSYYKSRLFPSLLIVLQKSINAIWLAIISVSIPGILSIKTPVITATIYVLTFFAVYRILKCFLVESFSPEKGDKKLVTSLAYISPKHLYKSVNIIVLFSFITLSLIVVLSTFGYRSDVVELLWFVYRVGILILLLWLATQKTLIFKLLPSAETQFGKLIHRIITIIYPIFISFVVLLFAIRTLGYPVLSYVLLKTCIKSFVIACIAFWIWKYLYHRLVHLREMRFKRENLKKDTPEEKRFHAITAICHISLNYLISIIAAIIIIRVWVSTFRDAIGSPAAPYLIQKIFGQIGMIFGAIGSGLRYRFFIEEGRYTTPIKIIIALVVLFASFFIARHIKKLLDQKVFYKLRLERGLKQTLSTITRYIIIGISALIGLSIAGIPLRSLAFFAGAFGIGIGFGMQNIISNFVSGIILLFERPMRVGDVITLEDGTLGTIDKISARSTTITTPDEITITVPNSKFIESRITNWTHPSTRMRGSVKVGVVYGSDTALVKKCLLEIAKQNPNVRSYPEPFVRFSEFGDSALKFELYFWADDPGKRWFTMSELNFAIDEVFQRNQIQIAFPQRDIHIRSVVPFPFQDIQEHVKQDGNQDKEGGCVS